MKIEQLKRNRFFQLVFAIPSAISCRRSRKARNARDDNYKRTVIGGQIVVRPNNIDGKFQMGAASDLARRIVVSGGFEPEVTQLLDRLAFIRGDVVNIGANVGLFALYFASTYRDIRKVYAIEPNPEAFGNLEFNIAENGHEEKVVALQTCIGDEPGEVEFAVIPGMPEYSSIGEIVHPSVSDRRQELIAVQVTRLQDAIASAEFSPSLLFIDTEGAEYLVLKGAESVLKKWMPLIVFECDDRLLQKFNRSSMDLERYLQSLGYVIRNAMKPRHSLVHPFIGEAIAIPPDVSNWLEKLDP